MTKDHCKTHVLAGVGHESEAISLDRQGDSAGAIHKYKEAQAEFLIAIDHSEPHHKDDRPALKDHRADLLTRIQYLEGLKGKPAQTPISEHIRPVTLKMTEGLTSDDKVEIAAFTALGAATGAVFGGPMGMTMGGAAAAFVAQRDDQVGETVRAAMGQGIKGVHNGGAVADRGINTGSGYFSKFGKGMASLFGGSGAGLGTGFGPPAPGQSGSFGGARSTTMFQGKE